MTVPVDELRLDGNAAAGLLDQIFACEITQRGGDLRWLRQDVGGRALILYGKAMEPCSDARPARTS